MATLIPNYTTSQIAVLSTAQIAALTTEDWAAFSSAQIVALTVAQIPAIALNGLRVLTNAQIASFEPADVARFTATQVRTYGQYTGSPALPSVASTPVYVVEKLGSLGTPSGESAVLGSAPSAPLDDPGAAVALHPLDATDEI